MKVTMIGTGYVGLVSGTCFAEIGHEVTCVDVIKAKIDMLKAGQCPIYEPGLQDYIDRNVKSNRLQFANDYESVRSAQAIFLAVGTPMSDEGQANLTYLKGAAEAIAPFLNENAVIVIKSTVPVGTCFEIEKVVAAKTKVNFHVVNNPEFLKEGSAVEDFMRPDRVVIGATSSHASQLMDELYAPLLRQGNPIIHMSNISAEMTKYAANCFLATKISFINEIARLCDTLGADIEEVRKGITSDKRIGTHFLYPGPGYGGSCFPKDVQALIFTAKQNDIDLKLIKAGYEVNEIQKTRMFEKMLKHFGGDLKGKIFTFWGVAFKANTDDVREAPAIYMAEKLLEKGAIVRVYDPVATPNFLREMESVDGAKEKLVAFNDKYTCLDGSDGLVVMTEWREFNSPDLSHVAKLLKSKVIFDARNLFNTQKVLEHGLKYYAVGKFIKN